MTLVKNSSIELRFFYNSMIIRKKSVYTSLIHTPLTIPARQTADAMNLKAEMRNIYILILNNCMD